MSRIEVIFLISNHKSKEKDTKRDTIIIKRVANFVFF